MSARIVRNAFVLVALCGGLTACGTGSRAGSGTASASQTAPSASSGSGAPTALPSAPTSRTASSGPRQLSPLPLGPSSRGLLPIPGIGGSAYPGAGAPTAALNFGAGPSIGTLGNRSFRQQLQDWQAVDVRGLDREGDRRVYGDRLESSRDLLAFYSRRQGDELLFRVDLVDLAFGAENGGLELTLLIDAAQGGRQILPDRAQMKTALAYELAITVRDSQDFEVVDHRGVTVCDPTTKAAEYLGSSYRADLDAVEFGIKKSLLLSAGWDGQSALRFQLYSRMDGKRGIADAFLEADQSDGSLDEIVQESWTAGRAKLAIVAVGNRATLHGSLWTDLVRSQTRRSSLGTPCGLATTLDSHQMLDQPLNIHMSGAFATGILWSSSSDPEQDGPRFIKRVAGFFDGQQGNGEGAFIPGTFADHMLPYFENHTGLGANGRLMARTQELYARLFGTKRGKLFWTPERVIRGQTFADILADENGNPTGFTYTVLDQTTHLASWFGAAELQSNRAFKINAINGVGCFLVSDFASRRIFSPEDGGANKLLRRLFRAKASDADQEQLIVAVADWEEFAGHKGSSDRVDQYHDSLRWIANHPWIEVVTLEDVAARGWRSVDRGSNLALPTVSNDWLHHASEENYDNWYYGHALEESFAATRPEIRPGVPHARILGDVATAGTLLGDAWSAATHAPGELGRLAELSFASALYRTAWHREDMHDLSRSASNGYQQPDLTKDEIVGFSYGLQTHAGDAAVVARAAQWAANPGTSGAVAVEEDVDLDGEAEQLLYDEQVFYVFERDGGRIKSAFVRDPLSAEGALFLGSPMSFTGGRDSVEVEGDTNKSTDRNSFLKDWWLTSPGTNRYVNEHYVATVSSQSVGWVFRSKDGMVQKSVSLAGGTLEVHYELPAQAGRLYLRGGFSPHLAALVEGGQSAMSFKDDGKVLRVQGRGRGSLVEVELGYGDAGHNTHYNPKASDGTPRSPRDIAFSHMVELDGSGSFRFAIRAKMR